MKNIVKRALVARTVAAMLVAAACPHVFGQSTDVRNWTVPLLWSPAPAGSGGDSAQQTGEFSASVLSGPLTGPLPLVAVTPCRVVDTRLSSLGFTGAFGAPQMLAGSQRSIPVPSGNCGIPGTARA